MRDNAGSIVVGQEFRTASRSESGVRARVLDALFASAFNGLVYAQIWEDPDVDLEALQIAPGSRVLTIASGGCNVLAYLRANPAAITAIDLNPAHVALTRLRLCAAAHLPGWDAFYRFFGAGNDTANIKAYWRYLAPRLDDETRAYWERRSLWSAKPRVAMFANGFYRHGLLGRCIGLGHAVARAYGVDLGDLQRAGSLADQRAFFRDALSPLFDRRLLRWAMGRRLALYGLGIPPAQYALLADGQNMADVLRERVERLVCSSRVRENYFAWQAVTRSYAGLSADQLPPYLQPKNFERIRWRTGRVSVVQRSLMQQLAASADGAIDRFVLLDAQDWMDDAQLNALWREITRTASAEARVIFRTAAEPSLLPGRLAPELLAQWCYEADASRAWTQRDRSAVYGGFHLYVRGS